MSEVPLYHDTKQAVLRSQLSGVNSESKTRIPGTFLCCLFDLLFDLISLI